MHARCVHSVQAHASYAYGSMRRMNCSRSCTRPGHTGSLLGHFSNPLYLVMHWSDCHDYQSTLVLQTVLVMILFSSRSCSCTRMLTMSCPRTSTNERTNDRTTDPHGCQPSSRPPPLICLHGHAQASGFVCRGRVWDLTTLCIRSYHSSASAAESAPQGPLQDPAAPPGCSMGLH